MAWQTPKTNWAIQPTVNGMYNGDWFNSEDYNRIAGNLVYLGSLGSTIYKPISLQSMPTITKQSYGLYSYINLLEDNLYAITQASYSPPTYTGRKVWKGNAPGPTVDDLNRLEQTIQFIYENYQRRMEGWTKLPVNMPQNFGGSEF